MSILVKDHGHDVSPRCESLSCRDLPWIHTQVIYRIPRHQETQTTNEPFWVRIKNQDIKDAWNISDNIQSSIVFLLQRGCSLCMTSLCYVQEHHCHPHKSCHPPRLASNTPSATKHPDEITTNTGCSAAPGAIKQWPEEIMQLQLKESTLLRPRVNPLFNSDFTDMKMTQNMSTQHQT